jgi:hypothetical protein
LNRANILIVPLLLAFTFLVYLNSIHSDFIGDDIGRIVGSESYFKRGLVEVVSRVLPDRPVLGASLWLNYKVGGLDPLGYKLFGILLHALVGITLFFFIRELARTADQPVNPWICALLAMAFVAHPLNNQAVNSIAQRGVLLGALFFLLSFQAFLRFLRTRDTRFLSLSALSYLIALLSKTNVIFAPFAMLAFCAIFFRRNFKQNAVWILPFVAISLVPLIFYGALNVNPQTNSVDSLTYFLIQIRMIWKYLTLLLFPWDLHFLYSIDHQTSWLTVLAGALHLAVLAMAIVLLSREKKIYAFLAFAMYLSFMPESGVFPIHHLFFEHRAYFPVIFVFAAMAFFLSRIEGPRAKTVLVLIGGWAVVLGSLNLIYNSKIDTYKKWFAYNWQANPTDYSFNIYHLEYFMVKDHEYGQTFANQMVTAHPDDINYLAYQKVYSVVQLQNSEKAELADWLAARLGDPQVEWNIEVREFMSDWVIHFWKRNLAHVESLERSEHLMHAQMPVIAPNSILFSDLVRDYRALLTELIRYRRQQEAAVGQIETGELQKRLTRVSQLKLENGAIE